MAPAQREQLRLSLLRFLDANGTRFPLASDLLLQLARSEGRTWLQSGELEEELAYLADKGLVMSAPKLISPELRAWRITAAGRDLAAELGLV